MTELLPLRTIARAVVRRSGRGPARPVVSLSVLVLAAFGMLASSGCGKSQGCDDLSYYCKFCPAGSTAQTDCADLVSAAGKHPLESSAADEKCAAKIDDFAEKCPIPSETGGDTGETGGQ